MPITLLLKPFDQTMKIILPRMKKQGLVNHTERISNKEEHLKVVIKLDQYGDTGSEFGSKLSTDTRNLNSHM